MASDFKEKFNSFMARRNGPDQLARDALILAIVLLVVSAFTADFARTLFLVLGVAAMAYSYWRMFSTDSSRRGSENAAYLTKRNAVLGKVKAPFQKAAKQGQKAASQAKCGEKFEKKA